MIIIPSPRKNDHLLSIIIVNYKTAELTLNCVRSIMNSDPSNQFEFIVVDNDSNDQLESMLGIQFPFVKFIQMGYNAGFARANNVGINVAQGDCYLLLNSDTITEDDAISKCYHAFIASTFAACGIQLLNADRSPQPSGFYNITGGLNVLLQLPVIGYCIKWLANSVKAKKPGITKVEKFALVDWVNGAFLMAKKSSVEKAGLLDEDFFLYAEETEWCSRLKQTGDICIYGGLHVIHLQGESAMATFNSSDRNYSNIYDKKGKQIMVSSFVRIRKQFGVLWFLINLFLCILEIPMFLVAILFKSLAQNKGRFTISHFKGYCTNMGRVFQLCFTIISNKPHFYKEI